MREDNNYLLLVNEQLNSIINDMIRMQNIPALSIYKALNGIPVDISFRDFLKFKNSILMEINKNVGSVIHNGFFQVLKMKLKNEVY